MNEHIAWGASWQISKYADDDTYKRRETYGISRFSGNLGLNEGINALLLLAIGGGGTAFNNGNAYLGVGDSSTAAAAAQTGLQAAANKLYKAMDQDFPVSPPTSQQLVFQSTFGANDANWAWAEFTVANGDSDAATNLNRKVSAQGTKTVGQTWVLTLTITFS